MAGYIQVVSVFIAITTLAVAQQSVETGPGTLPANTTPSVWLKGMSPASGQEATTLRIVRAVYANQRWSIRALPIDVNGNLIGSPGGLWSVKTSCAGTSAISETVATVSNSAWNATPLDVMICIDNSLSSNGFASECSAAMRDKIATASSDSVNYMLFSEDQEFIESLSEVPSRPSHGLASVYTSITNAIAHMQASAQRKRVVILLTASDDQSSVSTTPSILATKASSSGVPIYTIRMLQTTHGYIFSNISALTGGRSYAIDNTVDDIAAMVSQIILSEHAAIDLSAEAVPNASCADVRLTVSYKNPSGTEIVDSILVPLTAQYTGIANTIVATFPTDSESDIREHYTTLASLAELLTADTSLRIVLIGHTSSDAKGDHAKQSLLRAEMVRDVLVGYGVRSAQIRLRGVGSTQPLYYFIDSPQHRIYNNRVEMQKLVAEELPYTISVDQANSEEKAIVATTKWKDRGYKAYFKQVLTKNVPAYTIHLWGYASLQEAQSVSTKITKEFNVRAIVD